MPDEVIERWVIIHASQQRFPNGGRIRQRRHIKRKELIVPEQAADCVMTGKAEIDEGRNHQISRGELMVAQEDSRLAARFTSGA